MKNSTRSILGVVTGNIIYLAISMMGLGAILMKLPSALFTLRIAGILFILYSAWTLIKAGFSRHSPSSTAQSNERSFIQGVVTILSNSKAFIFWIIFLPGFVNSEISIIKQIATLGTIAILIDTSILILYGYLASLIAPFLQGRSQRAQFLISGFILIVVAGWLALSN